MNNLDFKNGSTNTADYSIWAEGSTAVGAVPEGWLPIGDNSTDASDTRFTAVFEGNDYTISNIFIDRSSISYVGLFGYVGFSGEIHDLGIEGGSVTGSGDVGCLVGNNSGEIVSCYATGTAEATGGFSQCRWSGGG